MPHISVIESVELYIQLIYNYCQPDIDYILQWCLSDTFQLKVKFTYPGRKKQQTKPKKYKNKQKTNQPKKNQNKKYHNKKTPTKHKN